MPAKIKHHLTDEEMWAIVSAPTMTATKLATQLHIPLSSVEYTRRLIRRNGWICRVWFVPCAGCRGLMTFHRDRTAVLYHPACLEHVQQDRPWDALRGPSSTHTLTIDRATALLGLAPKSLRTLYLQHVDGLSRNVRVSPAEVEAIRQLRAGNGRSNTAIRWWTDNELEVIRDPTISDDAAARRLSRSVSQVRARRQRDRAVGIFTSEESDTWTTQDVVAKLGCSDRTVNRLARELEMGRTIPGLAGKRYTDDEALRLAEAWRQRNRTAPGTDDERFYSVTDVGELLGISRQRVDQLIRYWFPQWLDRPESPKRFSRNDIRALNTKRLRKRKGGTIK